MLPEETITKVNLNKNSLNLVVGQEEDLIADVILGSLSENDHIIWQSENSSIVAVDDDGHVNAVSYGNTNVYAVSDDSGDVAVCHVIVTCNHNYETKTYDASCTENGKKVTTCTICGDTKEDIITSLGHNMSEIIPIIAPSCESEGQNMIKCSRCDYSEMRLIDATGHQDNDGNNRCDDCSEELSASSKCSCNCHKSGFMRLIWKILRFFYKLFKMNKVCGCGVAHY